MTRTTRWTGPDAGSSLRVDTTKDADAAWVILQGEADLSTLLELEAALARVELDAATSVHLHVTELDFADGATVQRLSTFARQARRSGHDVRTCGARPILRKVAGVLGVQDDLGLA